MRAFLYILTSLAVIGLAFWAYRENYATQQALSEAEKLRDGIRSAHSRLAVLRAEWAYQNRPERLRDLAVINFDRLGLLPLHPDQFGQVDQISYPAPPLVPITNPVDVSTMAAEKDPL
ncbi:cell division protein FtsL [Sulfitobacter sp. JB4-11]|uniref:cell division protein FtsL n=1 Tax=Sulfitobacter rhodophyticola TaxID=3238304 RepID=UPI003519035D